ncbi:2046_t:CDS:2, partial [Funneliformis geosporum]
TRSQALAAITSTTNEILERFEVLSPENQEQPQELEQKKSMDEAQQQALERSGECNKNDTKDVGQQVHNNAMTDGLENVEDSSENDEELDLLLKKAEESLQTNQSIINKNFPSLNVGISIDEQLYIRKHPSGIVKLRQDEIFLHDNSSQKNQMNSKKTISSSMTFDDDQDICAKLSKKERQKLRESTIGPGWFDMKKPEITPEIKRDLQIIKLRNVLDPKRFYKKDNTKGLPKYFEIGTIKEGPTEFFSSRIPRKERKQTIADELLADEKSKSYFKRKFSEIQEVVNPFFSY